MQSKKILVLSILTLYLGLLSNLIAAEDLREGLRYWKITNSLQQSAHILEVDPKRLEITAAHANDVAQGRETVASIAKRHHAIAAINGGFFKGGEMTDGLPAGILKIQGQWYGIAYRPRGAIGWSTQIQSVLMDRVQTKTNVYLNHKKFPIYSVNQPGVLNKAVLYTDAYGKIAPSPPNAQDIVIQNNRIIYSGAGGNTPIPKGGYVYSIGPKAIIPNHPVDIGNSATVNIEVIPQASKEQYLGWQMVDNIIGGSPLLISRGKIVFDNTNQRGYSTFIDDRHARTAVGILKNGHWLFVVVEQNPFNENSGMTIPELASLMEELGSDYALNLDGGSSSTLYIDQSVVNRPKGEEDEGYSFAALRSVSDAILILPK